MKVVSAKPPRFLGRPLLPAAPLPTHRPAGHDFAFAVFLLLVFVLFVRPMELLPFPEIYGSEIYLYLILACCALGFPVLLEQFRVDRLAKSPITLCLLGFALAIALSHLSRFSVAPAFFLTLDFLKTLLFFLLFVGLVTTPDRLRHVLNVLLWSTLIVATAAILQYHDLLTLPTISALRDGGGKDAMSGKDVFIQRLRGTGIFQDPNDVCVLFATAVPLALYRLTDKRWGYFRLFWLGRLALLFSAVYLTHSRGGLLAVLAGVGFVLVLRFGLRVGALLAFLALPGVVLLGGGRQTSFETGHGTAQDRILLWSDGLQMFRAEPMFGIGREMYAEGAGQVAHNSYLHAITETGLFGGALFLGVFLLTARRFWQRRTGAAVVKDPTLCRLLPFVGGSCAGYCMGMMTLSLTYLIPTVMIAAIGEVVPRLSPTDPETPEDRFDARLLLLFLGAAVVFIGAMYVFVRIAMARG